MIRDDLPDRAMFADVDREYLNGDREYPHRQQGYRREITIRDRFHGGLRDLRTLQRTRNEKALEKILDLEQIEQRETRDDMVAAIALFFELHEIAGWDFEDTLTRAIEEAYAYAPDRRETLTRRVVDGRARLPETKPAPSINEINERVQEKIANGERLTDREVRLVVKHGSINTVPLLREYLQERRKEESREDSLARFDDDLKAFTEDE